MLLASLTGASLLGACSPAPPLASTVTQTVTATAPASSTGPSVTMTTTTTAVASPTPTYGGGDDWFVTNVAAIYSNSNAVALAGARALIPLAHTVCDLRSKGNDDFQAAQMLWKAHAGETLGLAAGSVLTLERDMLDIVEFAAEAYCPQYANGNY